MKTYQINPRNKPNPYMTVRLNDRNPDMIELGFPGKGARVLFDCRAGADLMMAINALCRQAGHPYLPSVHDE